MRIPTTAATTVMLAWAAALLLAGCSVSVNESPDKDHHQADVDVKTPLGNVSVRAGGETAADTGLRVYPGAHVTQKHDGADSATVNVGGGVFGVRVAAANYETNASQDAIAAFYRDELKAFGPVTECHGNIDFHGRKAAQPVCREDSRSRELQLAVGTEENQRIVAIKPHGTASEFALVHVATRSAD